MSRARRQILGACLGTFLLLLLYRHRTNDDILLTPSQDASKATLNIEINPNFLWRKLPVRHPVAEVQQLPVTLPQMLPKVQSADSKISRLNLDR
jgi:hypothetical protein